MFPFINLFCMFLSLWAATTPRFRTANVKHNWIVYYGNLYAAGINALAILFWLFTWISA